MRLDQGHAPRIGGARAAAIATLAVAGAIAPLTTATRADAVTPHVISTTLAPGTILEVDYLGGTLAAFAPGSSGNATPVSTVTLPSNHPYTMTFDRAGNMWVAGDGGNRLYEYTQAQIAAGGSPTPAVTVTVPNTGGPQAISFDRSDDLWVADGVRSTVYMYTPSQYASTGSPTPTITLTSDVSHSIDAPDGIAFDGRNNLYVANVTTSTVSEFTPAQYATSGSPTPAVVLSATSNSLDGPEYLQFDSSGNLWVANITNSSIVRFLPNQLTASGSPVPAVRLTADASNSIYDPDGLSFDADGNMWVGNYYAPSVVEFTPSQYSASGSPTPAATIAGANTGFSGPGNVIVVPPTGYGLTSSGGQVKLFGGAADHGSPGSPGGGHVVVGTAPVPDGSGYWVANDIGQVVGEGTTSLGSLSGPLNKPIVGIAATPDGKGYWLVATDGGIFSFGDAGFHGSTGAIHLNKPIVGMASTPDGKGYWLVASDGGIFAFGDAHFYGSTGSFTLNKPVVGMATALFGQGYWLVASDGGIFAFGDAHFYGSTGNITLNQPVVGMAATPDKDGYWFVAADGGIFAYGDAKFHGTTVGTGLTTPIVGMFDEGF